MTVLRRDSKEGKKGDNNRDNGPTIVPIRFKRKNRKGEEFNVQIIHERQMQEMKGSSTVFRREFKRAQHHK